MLNEKGPKLIVIFSGKRKSGKDYVTDLLQSRLPADTSAILRLSFPLKAQYAKENGLDFERLLDASEYKEGCRVDMIRWGEEKRKQDPAVFIKAIATGPGSEKPIWIISDARRITDIECLTQLYSAERLLLVRIEASDAMRAERGWQYTTGVDDAESECDLDATAFDITIKNENDSFALDAQLNDIINIIKLKINS